jgi:cysteinyl-tRNA synthetase
MEIKLYNNLTRKKEVFKPISPNILKYYACGPTTYDFFHVGNARAFVTADLIHRVFKAFGHEVTFVRNYTDVDDKIIDRARELNVDAISYSDRFVKECEKDFTGLGMLPASFTPKVSESMPEIISMIETLLKKEFAYIVNGEVLYHVPKFKEYGKLSKVKLDSLSHGIRVETDGHKKNPSDFVLWKPAKAGEPAWDSPWGKGRPGWHIECSAMAKKYLGDTIDLHSGAVDLLFPHHENEIAQSEAANGCPFCAYWVHNEFLNFGSEKMSKSLGNVVTARHFMEKYSGEILRQLVISVHYRSKIDWSEEAVSKAMSDVERIHEYYFNLLNLVPINVSDEAEVEKVRQEFLKFKEELANDFNMPGALGVLFSVIKDFNRHCKTGVSKEYLIEILKFTNFVKDSTGIIHDNPEIVLEKLNQARKNFGGNEKSSDAEVNLLIQERSAARLSKNWARSDEIRNRLNELGVAVKDNSDGSVTWSYK